MPITSMYETSRKYYQTTVYMKQCVTVDDRVLDFVVKLCLIP